MYISVNFDLYIPMYMFIYVDYIKLADDYAAFNLML